jgi:iron complex outermembrane receptor protein
MRSQTRLLQQSVSALTLSALLSSTVHAAEPGPARASASHAHDHGPFAHAPLELETVVVTAGPLGRTAEELAQPVSILQSTQLRLQMQPTLGDTLSQQVGVNSSAFGPVSSRPIIRGLGEDRIQILSNGSPNIDASSISADHAIAIDPLSIDRVEIVRGPAALLYGPNGIGGVVNLIDGRIAEKALSADWRKPVLRGAFDGRYTSADAGGAGSSAMKFGLGPIVFHLDGFKRSSSDLRIPGETHTAAGRARSENPSVSGRLPNSASRSDGGGAGGSIAWDEGFFGLSYSGFNTRYGAVAERDVTIDLRQRRWDSRGAFQNPLPGIKALNYKFSSTDYEHLELEPDGEQAFKTRGYTGRLELVHEPWGLLEGALGYQLQASRFRSNSTDLEHLLLPGYNAVTHSAFLFEEIAVNSLRYQFGARIDQSTAESQTVAGLDKFAQSRSRDFTTMSLSGGVVYDFSKDYALAFNTGLTQRPPTAVELFSNGVHHATGTYELGDPNLSHEQALTLDLSIRRKTGRITGSLGVFFNHFDNFIGMFPTGETHGADDHAGEAGEEEALPEYQFRATRAQLYGAEAELVFHLIEPRNLTAPKNRPEQSATTVSNNPLGLHLDLKADYVRARDAQTGRSLPRIPPLRLQTALVHDWNRLQSRLETQWVKRQGWTAPNEEATAGYVLLNASLAYCLSQGPTNWEIYVRGTNLTDRDARVHTSFVKDVAPLAGRAVLLGMRMDF